MINVDSNTELKVEYERLIDHAMRIDDKPKETHRSTLQISRPRESISHETLKKTGWRRR